MTKRTMDRQRGVGMMQRYLILASTFVLGVNSAVAAVGSRPPARSWPAFPVPSKIYQVRWPKAFDKQIALETLAGLAAYHARITGAGPMIWINSDQASEQHWFKMYHRRYPVPISTDWPSLVKQMQKQGILKGYVLYSSASPTTAGKHPKAGDFSVNLATSLCAPLGAVALDDSLAVKAQKQSLPKLADTRGKDMAWLLAQLHGRFSKRLLGLLLPQQPNQRDELVAANALVVSDNPAGGYRQGLLRMHPGGIVVGWGGNELDLTSLASKYALRVCAADWVRNLPVLSSGVTGLKYPLAKRAIPAAAINDDGHSHYVAFINSDGDNLAWALGGFTTDSDVWGNPARGKIPFGWSTPLQVLLQVCPCTVDYLRSSATAQDDFTPYWTGYFYLDEFGRLRGGLKPFDGILRRQRLFMRKLKLHTMMAFCANKWNSHAALRGYRHIAAMLPKLNAVFVVQYDPYAAGRGKIIWLPRKPGGPLPVLSALASIWNMPSNKYAGSPKHVAKLLNRWAARPVKQPQDRFTWVVVHAWSRFKSPKVGGKPQQLFAAAQACIGRLGRGIKVVTPEALAILLNKTHGPVAPSDHRLSHVKR
ncbi:MAG: hypothetical protein HKL96_05395 [Phycisphaerales bacterium]|nr:hypothetical protein [Phycisphaerales bacterium]